MTWDGGHPKRAEFFCALVSCTSSAGVLLTFCCFPKLWNKLFMQIILYISLCDFIANATVFSGTPSDNELCFFQGLLQQFFYPASWLWTTLLTYLLYSLVIDGKISLKKWHMHLICWGLPLLGAVLPLTTDTYRSLPEDDDFCEINPRDAHNSTSRQVNTFWQILTFEIPILLCSALMVLWGVLMYRKMHPAEKDGATAAPNPAVVTALRAMIAYPLILMVCWLPNALQINIAGSDGDADTTPLVVINSLSIMQGLFTSTAFFYNSREARNSWYALLLYCGLICLVSSVNEETGVKILFWNCCGSRYVIRERTETMSTDLLRASRGSNHSAMSESSPNAAGASALDISGGGAGGVVGRSYSAAQSQSRSHSRAQSSDPHNTSSSSHGGAKLSHLKGLLTLPTYDLEDDDVYFGRKPFSSQSVDWRDSTHSAHSAHTGSAEGGSGLRFASEVQMRESVENFT